MYRYLTILSILAALTLWSAPTSPVLSLKLQDGSTISGQLEKQDLGYFLHRSDGGRMLRWSQIEPASLSQETRDAVRALAFQRLRQAHVLYEGGNPVAAQPYYQEAYALHAYFRVADQEHPLLADLGYKLDAWVEVDGEWLSYVAHQRSLGHVYYNGRWMERANAIELKTFRTAAAEAQEARTEAAVDWAIDQALAEYPDSVYESAARKLRSTLIAKIRAKEAREERLADAREERERGWNHRDSYPRNYWKPRRGYIDPRYYPSSSIIVTDECLTDGSISNGGIVVITK